MQLGKVGNLAVIEGLAERIPAKSVRPVSGAGGGPVEFKAIIEAIGTEGDPQNTGESSSSQGTRVLLQPKQKRLLLLVEESSATWIGCDGSGGSGKSDGARAVGRRLRERRPVKTNDTVRHNGEDFLHIAKAVSFMMDDSRRSKLLNITTAFGPRSRRTAEERPHRRIASIFGFCDAPLTESSNQEYPAINGEAH